MSQIILYGVPQSTYVRTARMALEEKGVPYRLEPVNIREPAYREHHPFGKMPAMRHGDVHLYETRAIADYIDGQFDGAPLQPENGMARARMNQWISVVSDYLYADAIRKYVLERIFPTGPDGQINEAKLQEGLAGARHHLGVIDQAIDGHSNLAGKELSLADLFLAPIAVYLSAMPEGKETMAAVPKVSAWLDRISKRKSFQSTIPPARG